jgi:hypothetical protein
MPVVAAAPALLPALNALPTAAAVASLCVAVVAEIVLVPAVLLPGRTAAWLTASMPSVAGGAGMRYRSFAARILVMRVPWLAAALSAGILAAHSLARIGHVAGIAGLVASGVVLTVLLVAHHRPGAVREVARRTMTMMRRLSTTIM